MLKAKLKTVDFAAEREKAYAEVNAEREKITRSKERIKNILSGLQERESEYYMSLIREHKISIEELNSALEMYEKAQREISPQESEEAPQTNATGGTVNDKED
ncbi:MAG: hypothetical protein NC452_10015 [Eubacterium sp.]|nr:hypothetical protein [Eubacterium sp.]